MQIKRKNNKNGKMRNKGHNQHNRNLGDQRIIINKNNMTQLRKKKNYNKNYYKIKSKYWMRNLLQYS